MNIFITSAYNNNIAADWLWRYNENSSLVRVDNPEYADLILFAESHPGIDPYFRQVHNHPLFKKFPKKCVLYHDADRSITSVRTISPSIEKWQYNPSITRAGHYIARECENDAIDSATLHLDEKRRYLFNFIGGRTHPIRKTVLSLNYTDAFLKDTTGLHAWKLDKLAKAKYEEEYLQVMNDSYFVLCPRGIGPCSYRLFETMQLARSPIIISDEWVYPQFDFNWNEFAIFISEDKIAEIPAILERRKVEAIEMGIKARKIWEKYFSPQASLTTLVNIANDLIKEPLGEWQAWKNNLLFFKDKWHLKNYLRYHKNSLKRRITASKE